MQTVLVTGSNGLLGQKITEKILKEGGVNIIAPSTGENRYPVKALSYTHLDVYKRQHKY